MAQANLTFFYDNYSTISLLQFNYSYDQLIWHQPPIAHLTSGMFVATQFVERLPLSWAIFPIVNTPMTLALSNNLVPPLTVQTTTLSCYEEGDGRSQPIMHLNSPAAIVTLSQAQHSNQDELLLDILDANNHGFMARIIDLNGNKCYSNTITCHIN